MGGWLKELTQIVDEREEAGTKKHGKHHREKDVPVLEKPRRKGAAVLLPKLNANEDENHGAETTEQANNGSAFPWILGTSPLKSKEEADDGWDKDGCSGDVQLSEAAKERLADCSSSVAGNTDEKEDDDHRETADWEVDVKTPAPSDILSESTSEQGTSN